MPITKSSGTTPTERMLAQLCEQTFLRLWSYPNPYRDDGKELCDLLAVFGEHVFIFFDREGQHFTKKNRQPEENWLQWKREVVDRQVKSAHGAARYLRSGRGVFLDAKREVPFPIGVPTDRMIVHKIIVAHGAKDACAAFSEDNVYGSLAVSYGGRDEGPDIPFMVRLPKSDPVHVLDSHTLPIILGELDTFTDLVWYLTAKTDAIAALDRLVYCGEEDLLAHYFLNFDETARRHYIGTKKADANSIMIAEGEWKDFMTREEYRNKKEADKSSYFWDELIQRTSQNALNGTLLGDAKLLEGKSAIHEMAREPRFIRRTIVDLILRTIRSFPDTVAWGARQVSLLPSFLEDRAYVFLQLWLKDEYKRSDPTCRETRQAMLKIACGAAKNRLDKLNTVIGIAIDAPKFARQSAEDFLLMDCRRWPEETRAYYAEANRELKFFDSPSMTEERIHVQNFPSKKRSCPPSR